MGSTMGRAILSACLLPLCVLHLQGCGKPKEACVKGDKACKELQELLRETDLNCPKHPDSRFIGPPRLTVVGETCSAVEFLYKGGLPVVYTYARQAKDSEFTDEWGGGLPPLDLSHRDAAWGEELWNNVPFDPKIRRYRTMMYKLPPHKAFEVKLSDKDDAPFEGFNFSCPSKPRISDAVPFKPQRPYDLKLHRTDPRINKKNDEDSVCIDLHWAHPHTELNLLPDDTYFRIFTTYDEEDAVLFCEDTVGARNRTCGVPMRTATSQSSLSFATICGLWPKRRVVFTVEAFSCDGESVSTNMTAMTPPGAPTFTAALVTHPASQASSAGFWPKAIIDWIPQYDELIIGHAIYLALKGVGAMKLLCWMPFHKAGKGYLELPIAHKNHTHSRDAATLRDYDQRYHVHQEQQILVATRSVANLTRPDSGPNPGPDENLESPVSEYSMGNWLIMERYVKCLTSFSAVNPSYVSKPVELSWTEEQSMMLYD
ncbi:unnamed protein product [Symbiodinium microadriaticum]|nr:unnamed protein product [Symbiodinium microadriaticum]